MLRTKILPIVLAAMMVMAFSVAGVSASGHGGASGPGHQKQAPPFLITGKLPHLTKLLMQQWDNPNLNLSEEQKSKLLVVRKKTIGAVRQIGPKVAALEKQVVEGIFAGKSPEELRSQVEAIARMKTRATMVHLQCIHDTRNILTDAQLDLLKKL
ncbi:Spy/CpxP family protein refolding chaperone [Desulfolithobacter sp.]